MQGVKQVFDPRGILNPGKRCASKYCQGLSVVVWYQAFLECFEERLIEFIAGQA